MAAYYSEGHAVQVSKAPRVTSEGCRLFGRPYREVSKPVGVSKGSLQTGLKIMKGK